MSELRRWDYYTWGFVIIVTYIIIDIIGAGQTIGSSWTPYRIDNIGMQIQRLYSIVWLAGEIVSALFIGSLFWLSVKYWDREQKSEME